MKTTRRLLLVLVVLAAAFAVPSGAFAAQWVKCGKPSARGFQCAHGFTNVNSNVRASRIQLYFNGSYRGFAEIATTRGSAVRTVRVCDRARDGHGGPAIRIDRGQDVYQISTTEGRCVEAPWTAPAYKFRAMWAGHSTQFVATY